MTRLPRIIDIRDDLERARETSETDIDDDVSEVISTLERYSDPDGSHPVGLLDDAENTLLRLEERETSDTAIQRFRAARNRIEMFRDAIVDTDSDLVVVDTKIGSPETDPDTRIDSLEADRVDLHVSVVNLGEPTEGLLEVVFYDEDETPIHSTATEIVLDSDEEKTVTLDVDMPGDAAYYTAVAREASP